MIKTLVYLPYIGETNGFYKSEEYGTVEKIVNKYASQTICE